MKLLACGIITALLMLSPLFPQEGKLYTYYIEWQEVKGSKGYYIEIQDEKSQTEFLKQKLKTHYYEFKIPGGKYKFRIASLNKFGKPSSYTSWNSFLVDKDKTRKETKRKEEEEKAKQELKKAEEKKKETIEEKKEIKLPETKTKNSGFQWQKLIPGLPQYRRGDTLQSMFYPIFFSAISLAAYSEYRKGNALAQQYLNDPNNISFYSYNNSALSLYLWQARARDQEKHSVYQRNQRFLGLAAVLGYGFHLLDVYYIHADVGLDTIKTLETSKPNVLYSIRFSYSF